MEPRPRRRKTTRHRSLKRSSPKRPAISTPWPCIEAFFESGEVEISIGAFGHLPTLRHTAVAADEHNTIVALIRREGETLHQLLDRLDSALAPALQNQVLVDEINEPYPTTKSRRR